MEVDVGWRYSDLKMWIITIQNMEGVRGFAGFGMGNLQNIFGDIGERYNNAFEVNQLFEQRMNDYKDMRLFKKMTAEEKSIDISGIDFQLGNMNNIITAVQQYQVLVQEYHEKNEEYTAFCKMIENVENGYKKYKDVLTETSNILGKYSQYKPIEHTYIPVYESVISDLYKKQQELKEEMDKMMDVKKRGYKVITAVHNICKEQDVHMAGLKNPCNVCMTREINSCLPCGHTFCDGCISQTETSIRQKKCSVCRATYQRPIKLYLD